MAASSKPHPMTHLDHEGRVAMVDVGDKSPSRRRAVAEGRVWVGPALIRAITENTVAKGSVLEVARIAGIQAAKQTSSLIPLCHSLPLEAIDMEVRLEPGAVYLRSMVCTFAKTGVEMEALTAVSVAALTVVDMGKAIDRQMVIAGIRLVEKTGGQSGDCRYPPADGGSTQP